MSPVKSSIIDTHAHLDMAHFDRDRAEAISRAARAGVDIIINVGIDLKSSQKAIELAESHPGVFAAAGFHPHDAGKAKKEDIDSLARIAVHPKVVAIGETGLDYYRDYSPRDLQARVLKWQLELGTKLKLPVIIHSRQADKETQAILQEWISQNKPERKGVIHCFGGDAATARRYLEMGFFISFGAYITYPSSHHLQDVILNIPEDRLLVETDAPFLPPQSHRGKRNEPAFVPLTVEAIARIKRTSPEEIARMTTENATNLFRLPVK